MNYSPLCQIIKLIEINNNKTDQEKKRSQLRRQEVEAGQRSLAKHH